MWCIILCWCGKRQVIGLEVGTRDCLGFRSGGLGFRSGDPVWMRNHCWVDEINNKPLMSKLAPHVYSRVVCHISYIKTMWIEFLCWCVIEYALLIVWLNCPCTLLHSQYIEAYSHPFLSCCFVFLYKLLCIYLGGVSGGVSWKMALELFLVYFIIYRYLVGLLLLSITSGNNAFVCFELIIGLC